MTCVVLPDGNNNATIPDDATDKIILPFNLSTGTIAFHRYVYTRKHFP